MTKPVHAKPSLYAYYFEALKEIALKYGYNLVLHGSMARDLDLIAIPWQEVIGNRDDMVDEFVKCLGGELMLQDGQRTKSTHHGRMWYVIDLNRKCYMNEDNQWIDPQFYIDLSVIPTQNELI